MTWYATERGKVRVISPTLCVWTNKSQNWPLKGRYERKSNYSHSVTCNRLDRKGNVGHCSSMTGWNREEEERGFSDKKEIVPFHQRKFGRESFFFGQKSAWKDVLIYRPKLQVRSPAKRIFSFGRTLARDGRQVSQVPGKSRTESLDRR